jgi:hypothetical protein
MQLIPMAEYKHETTVFRDSSQRILKRKWDTVPDTVTCVVKIPGVSLILIGDVYK